VQPSRREFLQRSASALCALRLQALDRRAGTHELAIDSSDSSDLQFLVPLLANVRIVQLGENGHGESESMRVRARIARFLVEQLDFDVLAFESSLFLAYLADQRLGDTDARRTLTSSLIGVWHTREMLPLFEFMRERRAAGKPIHLAGFDVQPIGSNRKQRPAFFGDLAAQLDPDFARTAVSLDNEFMEAYSKPSAQRREYLRANGERLAADYDRLAAFFERHVEKLTREKGDAALIARQEAQSAAAYVRFQSAADMRKYAETRDEGMFENLKFFAEQLFKDRRIVVWGHNYHLRHENAAIPPSKEVFPGVEARSMGTWTRRHFGRRVYTIGQYERTGTAIDNSRKEYQISAPGERTLEARLMRPGDKALFIDINQARTAAEGDWLDRPVIARYNGQHPETFVPSVQYDAVLMLQKVSPPGFV
jgi:erythromycin esterase